MQNRAELQQVLVMSERAGDRAMERHFYEEAAQYYQEALEVETIESPDRLRISEKIGYAYSLSGHPDAATPWFDRVLQAYLINPKGSEKSAEMLLKIASQLVLDCKENETLPVVRQAIQLAEVSGNTQLYMLANFRMSSYLTILGRQEEAAEFTHIVSRNGENGDYKLQIAQLYRLAVDAAEMGNAEDAYKDFESAMRLAKEHFEPSPIVTIWSKYAEMAWEFGDVSRAKACYEEGLLVARQYRLGWRIPLFCLHYADLLAWMGQLPVAHGYLLEALSYTANAPILDVDFACSGIPIALKVQDEVALAKCVRPDVIELAFQSGKPSTIANVASVFAQLYAAEGKVHAARTLLHRALKEVHDAGHNLNAILEIARHGATADIPKARALIEARIRLPHADAFQAGLALFNAFIAQRRGHARKAREYALDAAARYSALQGYGFVELAHSIIPGGENAFKANLVHAEPLSHMQALLTTREQEVAALVLKGLTNREIAERLNIAQHTVEKHMNSIMGRLGIRSRHQLAQVVDPPTGIRDARLG